MTMRNWMPFAARRRAPVRPRRFRPQLEALEDRVVPSGNTYTVSNATDTPVAGQRR